jgi:hypothetical protein
MLRGGPTFQLQSIPPIALSEGATSMNIQLALQIQ